MTGCEAIYRTDMRGLISRGKVRDIYDLGDRLMIVASDRISAFDVVMDQPVPGKGIVLTGLTRFWLESLRSAQPHHLDYVVQPGRIPRGYEEHADTLSGRAMVCRKAQVLPVECVVRGYVAGGGWKEYQQTGSVSGIALPRGLRLADRLPEPLFTPSTKAVNGHDEPISFERACDEAEAFLRAGARQPARNPLHDGRALMSLARERALAIYSEAAAYAESCGIIVADTKFEFGLIDGELALIDEVLTPDSSRFWDGATYAPGASPHSFNKQFVRDFVAASGWDKEPPAPVLPDDVIAGTRDRYVAAYERLTGSAW